MINSLTDEYFKNANKWFNLILQNLDKNLNWALISRSPNVTMENISDNLTLPWDWSNICYNPNLTIEFVKKFAKKKLNKTNDL